MRELNIVKGATGGEVIDVLTRHKGKKKREADEAEERGGTGLATPNPKNQRGTGRKGNIVTDNSRFDRETKNQGHEGRGRQEGLGT